MNGQWDVLFGSSIQAERKRIEQKQQQTWKRDMNSVINQEDNWK